MHIHNLFFSDFVCMSTCLHAFMLVYLCVLHGNRSSLIVIIKTVIVIWNMPMHTDVNLDSVSILYNIVENRLKINLINKKKIIYTQ